MINVNDFLGKEVTIIDTGNYLYSNTKDEDFPMKAVLFYISPHPCFWVKSVKTGKEYEMYDYQIKEFENEIE